MLDFIYSMPTKVIFGENAESQVAEELNKLGVSCVLVVYGKDSVVKSGLLEKITSNLSRHNISWSAFGGAKPNPTLQHVKKGVPIAVDIGADLILALGGGSVIDTAKAIALGAANTDKNLWDFWTGAEQAEKCLPVASVLTIPAAGSETSCASVLMNTETDEKIGLSADVLVPRLAFLDPKLAMTLPRYQITCGIVDIMMHTLDRYFVKEGPNELTDEFAEALLRLVIRNGKRILDDPKDMEAMSEIMWAGSVSHNGLTGLGGQGGDFSTHMIGHELSAMFDVAHGASLSAVWGSISRYIYKEKPSRYARYGRKVWGLENESDEFCARMAIDLTVAFFKDIEAPVSIRDLNITYLGDDTIRRLAENCIAKSDGRIGSFKPLNTEDICEILKMANG